MTRALLVTALLGLAACSSAQDASPPSSLDTSTTATSTTAPVDPPTSPPDDSTSTSTSVPEDSTTTSSSSSTVPTSSAPPSSTTTAVPGTSGLALTRAGVGPLAFGVEPELAVEFLRGVLGPPTADSGWGPASSPFGSCPGSEVRGVSFGPLTVLFGDPDGRREFYAWTYDEREAVDTFHLATGSGIGLGATMAEVTSAHPGAVIVPAAGASPAVVTIDGVRATFDEADRVASLGGGRLCDE